MALTVNLAEQIDIADQPLRRVLHLIFQLLLLRRTRPSGESGPYRSKIDCRVVRPDHRQGMRHDGDSDISVEAFEVLPCCLAPVNDGVQMGRPIVRPRSYLHVDTVEHRSTLATTVSNFPSEFFDSSSSVSNYALVLRQYSTDTKGIRRTKKSFQQQL